MVQVIFDFSYNNKMAVLNFKLRDSQRTNDIEDCFTTSFNALGAETVWDAFWGCMSRALECK